MLKTLTLLLFAGALALVSCSGDNADTTSTDVISEAEAASQAAAEIVDDASAQQALDDLEKQLNNN